MIDYKTYETIQKYLEKGDMESLKNYLELEKKKYYLCEARAALLEYVKGNRKSLYDYVDDKLVISDGHTGFYILNSDELLNAQIRKGCGGYAIEPSVIMKRKNNLKNLVRAGLDGNLEIVEKSKLKIGEVKTDKHDRDLVVIRSADSKISHLFQKRLYEESLKILGEDTEVTISKYKRQPAFVAKSEKGLCLTMGIKRG